MQSEEEKKQHSREQHMQQGGTCFASGEKQMLKKLPMCDICGKQFSSIDCFQSHKIHLCQERPFSCKKCNASFKVKEDLIFHDRCHSQPFQCQHCSKGFGSAFYLNRHMSSRHRHVSKPKTQLCLFCGKGCVKKDCKQGEKTQKVPCSKPFTCVECGAGYMSHSNLDKHMWKHSGGDETFKCDTCFKNFFSERQLAEHVLIHSNLDFLCHLCGIRLARKTGLCNHLAKVHKVSMSGQPKHFSDV